MSESSTPNKPNSKRLFFALWPDETLCQALLQQGSPYLQQAQGNVVAAANLHLTLTFLGQVEATQQQCLEQAADAICLPRFEMVFDYLDYWARSQVLWAGSSSPVPALLALSTALQAAQKPCGLAREKRPYQPHITLVRKCTSAFATLPIEPLHWRPDAFVLVESITDKAGARYAVLRRWPLQNAA